MFICSVLAATTALFVIHVPVTSLHFFLSLGLSTAVMLFFYPLKTAVKLAIIGVLIIVACIIFAGLFFDLTWDGNAYRKTITYMLKQGYNPVYESFFDAVARIGTIKNASPGWPPWYEGYPKGAQTFAAVIYAVTNNIETGKCINPLLILSASLIVYGILHQLFKLKPYQAALCAVSLCANPVTLVQICNFYDDGALGMLLFICIASLLYLTLRGDGTYPAQSGEGKLTRKSYAAIFASIVIGFNVKFSAIIHFAIFTGAFYFYWLIKDLYSNRWKKLSRPTIHSGLFFMLCAIAGVAVFGFAPYITNIFRFGTPLYPLFGQGAIDILSGNTPTPIRNQSLVVQFVYSFLSATSNDLNLPVDLKIPFTSQPQEFAFIQAVDTRLGGWGVSFSGVAIISIIVIVFFLFKFFRQKRAPCIAALVLFAAVVIPIFAVPGMFWARYNLQLFIIPVMALVMLFSCADKPSGYIAPFLMLVLIAGNAVPSISTSDIYRKSQEIREQLRVVKELNESYVVEVTNLTGYDFNGQFINMFDAGVVNYEIVNELEGYDGTFYANFPIAYKAKSR
jgi:hypothetical protein